MGMVRTLLHPDDLPMALKNWEKCHVSGEAFEMEYRMRDCGGRLSLAPGPRHSAAGFRRHHREMVWSLHRH